MMDQLLYDELERLAVQVNVQIAQVAEIAADIGCQPSQVRDQAGGFMLTPLLLAKAQLLNAMAILSSTT